MSSVDCPPWCTTTGYEHNLHEGLLFELPGAGAVTLSTSDAASTELNLWDQTGAGNGARLGVQLGAKQTRTLARVVAGIESWEDMARFTKALIEAADVLDATAHPTDKEATTS